MRKTLAPYERRDHFIAILEIARCGLCLYTGPNGRGKSKCDCKFGGCHYDWDKQEQIVDPPGTLARMSEQCGCPELYLLQAILGHITKREWESIVRRSARRQKKRRRVG